MIKFKRIYIEITNKCNLNCSFCSIDGKKKKEMSLEEFELVLKKIDSYTDYIYLHVKGEPLLHSNFKEIMTLSKKYNKIVNITTNGSLLKYQLDNIINSNIHQLNISLQSLNDDRYLKDIFDSVKLINEKTNIQVVFRFWALNDSVFTEFQKKIINKMINYFKLENNITEIINNNKNIRLKKNLYLNKADIFKWPSLNNNYVGNIGTCYGLRKHIAILSDGTVIPCCLDSDGIINLGNIFMENLDDILNNNLATKIKTNFQNNKVCHELCQKCSYRERFTNKKEYQ